MPLAEGFLQRGERIARTERRDRLHVGAVHLDREQQARARDPAVEEPDRARAAHAVLAADVHAGRTALGAQEVVQQQPRRNLAP